MKNDFIKSKLNNKKQSNNKKPSFYIVLGLLLFCVIGSLLGSIAFAQNCSKKSSSNIAYADEVNTYYEYQGKNVLVMSTLLEDSTRPEIYDFQTVGDNTIYNSDIIFPLSIDTVLTQGSINSNGLYIPTIKLSALPLYKFNLNFTNINLLNTEYCYFKRGNLEIFPTNNFITFDNSINYNYYDSNNNLLQGLINSEEVSYCSFGGYLCLNSGEYGYLNYGYLTIKFSPLFNNNVASIDFGSYVSNITEIGYNINLIQNYISYIDNNGNYLTLTFNLPTNPINDTSLLKFEYRRYNIITITNNDYYKNGYDIATSEWQQIVQELETQFANDIENVKIEYENIGFNKGVENANNYTFLSLFTSLIDAPIQALTGLLNFEVLGFNLFDLLTALITIALIIFVVRLFL